MPRRVAGGTAIITAATIIRSTTITATTITPGTTITTVTATGIANPGYSPALRARAHTSLLRTYAPPRVRLGSSPEDSLRLTSRRPHFFLGLAGLLVVADG